MSLWSKIKSWLAIILVVIAIIAFFYIAFAFAAGAAFASSAAFTVAGTTFLAGWNFAMIAVAAAGMMVMAFVLDGESAGKVVAKVGDAAGEVVGAATDVVGTVGSSFITSVLSSPLFWIIGGGVLLLFMSGSDSSGERRVIYDEI